MSLWMKIVFSNKESNMSSEKEVDKKEYNKTNIWNFIYLSSGVFIGITIGFAASYFKAQEYYENQQTNMVSIIADKKETTQSFLQVLNLIDKHYITKLTDRELKDKLLTGLLESLDAHSGYITSTDYDSYNADMEGKYGGIGIAIDTSAGKFLVEDVYEGSPSDKAGIKKGDYVVKVDNHIMDSTRLESSVDYIKGEIGSTIKLTLNREGVKDYFDLEVKRENIYIPASTEKYLYSSDSKNKYGYIKIRRFKEKTIEDFLDSYNDLVLSNKDGLKMKGLVIDLRDNPGGLINEVVGLLSLFLPNNTKVLKIVERNVNDTEYYSNPYTYSKPVLVGIKKEKNILENVMNDREAYIMAKFKQDNFSLPVVVLINRGSASASEIFAAAMKEYGRAKIIGERTFGKGSVQTMYDYGSQGGLIKLTTSLYYTGKNNLIQEVGVVPDIVIDLGGIRFRETDIDNHIKNPLFKGVVEDVGIKRVNKETDKSVDLVLQSALVELDKIK